MAKFEEIRTKNGQYRFNLVASNGEIVAPSESYHNRKDMLKTMKRLSKNAEKAWKRFEKQELKAKAASKKVSK